MIDPFTVASLVIVSFFVRLAVKEGKEDRQQKHDAREGV